MQYLRHALLFLGASLLFGAALVYVEAAKPAYLKIAEQMARESWYRVTLHGEPVGYMYTQAAKDRTGRWQFITTTHFLVAGADTQNAVPNTISKTLTFEAHPPHALHSAQFENRRGASIESTTISRTERKVVEEPGSEAAGREAPAANQYIATFGHTSYPQELNWQQVN